MPMLVVCPWTFSQSMSKKSSDFHTIIIENGLYLCICVYDNLFKIKCDKYDKEDEEDIFFVGRPNRWGRLLRDQTLTMLPPPFISIIIITTLMNRIWGLIV